VTAAASNDDVTAAGESLGGREPETLIGRAVGRDDASD
jgi:hypothetical protein